MNGKAKSVVANNINQRALLVAGSLLQVVRCTTLRAKPYQTNRSSFHQVVAAVFIVSHTMSLD